MGEGRLWPDRKHLSNLPWATFRFSCHRPWRRKIPRMLGWQVKRTQYKYYPRPLQPHPPPLGWMAPATCYLLDRMTWEIHILIQQIAWAHNQGVWKAKRFSNSSVSLTCNPYAEASAVLRQQRGLSREAQMLVLRHSRIRTNANGAENFSQWAYSEPLRTERACSLPRQ